MIGYVIDHVIQKTQQRKKKRLYQWNVKDSWKKDWLCEKNEILNIFWYTYKCVWTHHPTPHHPKTVPQCTAEGRKRRGHLGRNWPDNKQWMDQAMVYRPYYTHNRIMLCVVGSVNLVWFTDPAKTLWRWHLYDRPSPLTMWTRLFYNKSKYCNCWVSPFCIWRYMATRAINYLPHNNVNSGKFDGKQDNCQFLNKGELQLKLT